MSNFSFYACVYFLYNYTYATTVYTYCVTQALSVFEPPLSENFLDDGSDSSNSQIDSSFQRANSFKRGARLGVAFDPALGPGPETDGAPKVSTTSVGLFLILLFVLCV